jgi:alpha-ketoglutarate-dependent taurine dioxygenase
MRETDVVTTSVPSSGRTPLIIRPIAARLSATEWAAGNREFISAKLREHGALLFRGFDLNSPADFERFAGTIVPDLYGEYGDLPSEQQAQKIYQSTPYPNDKTILFHNEGSHTHRWPMKQFFFCVKPADEGGNTPIVDCREVYRRLDPAIVDRFREKGLVYVRNFSPGLDVSWQGFFKTSERSVVEEACRAANTELEWRDDDDELTIRQHCDAVVRHPDTGEWTFFNQVQLHHASCLDPLVREALLEIFPEDRLPRNVFYGDMSPIDDAVMAEVDRVYWDCAVSLPWESDDVMMLDNMLMAHARNPFKGTRKICVAMGEMRNRTSSRS